MGQNRGQIRLDSRSINKTERTPILSAVAKVLDKWKVFSGFLVAFAVSLAINIIARYSSGFAEWMSRYPVGIYSRVVGFITGILPFSVTEFVILMALPLVIFAVYSCLRGHSKTVLSFVLVVLAVFNISSVRYYRKGVDELLYIERAELTAENLTQAMERCNDAINELQGFINIDELGESHCTLTYSEIASELAFSYESLDYGFLSHSYGSPKQMALSSLYAHSRTSGMFVSVLGEINVNNVFPDFAAVYSMAHEMAHSLGIAREDEAEFMAFLACINSRDKYIRYAGYVTALDSLSSSLYSLVGKEQALEVMAKCPQIAIGELSHYGHFFDKYDYGFFSYLLNRVNDLYLKTQQQSDGIKSYSKSDELTVAWLLDE